MKRETIPASWRTATECANCGATEDLEYHHIVPLGQGGNNVQSNVVCLCFKCHNLVHGRKYTGVSHSELTKKGLEKARKQGKRIGQKEGARLHTRTGDKVKAVILQHCKDFGGTLADKDCIALAGCARNTYFRYKKELREQWQGRGKEDK